MGVVDDITRTVYRLRRMPDVDIERISYSLNAAEWREFVKYLEQLDFTGNAGDLSYIDHCQFMGMEIRKLEPANNGDSAGGSRG